MVEEKQRIIVQLCPRQARTTTMITPIANVCPCVTFPDWQIRATFTPLQVFEGNLNDRDAGVGEDMMQNLPADSLSLAYGHNAIRTQVVILV